MKPTLEDQDGQEADIVEASLAQVPSGEDEALTRGSAPEEPRSTGLNEKYQPSTEHLHRQGYIILLVLIYAAIFIAGWSILVLTSKHPIGRKSYDCFDNKTYCAWSSSVLEEQNSRTRWYIKKAQTLLATVSLLTIPLTSAVCAAAVVPWLQQSGQGMSLRQIITLSDKGWTSPYIYYRLLTPSGWQRYGSSFILLALLLHALGAALSPAISQMSAAVTIKVPASAPTVSEVRQLLTLQEITQESLVYSNHDDKATVLKLRNMLKGASLDEVQIGLWAPHNESCVDVYSWGSSDVKFLRSRCDTGGFLTYRSIGNGSEVWQSQLSNGFSTGVKSKQYLPRVNSSVSVELLDEMPPDCAAGTAALLLSYAGNSRVAGYNVSQYGWSVQACIPNYPTTSLFNSTDNAQTLTETAYLELYGLDIMDRRLQNITKITMSTTVGYFELPNYSNDNVPGPLLTEFSLPPGQTLKRQKRQREIPEMPDYVLSLEKNATVSVPGLANLELLPRKGPLLNIIYALFGNGSLPATYLTENATYNSGWSGETGNNPCLDLIPLSALFTAFNDNFDTSSECLDWWSMAQGDQIDMFLGNFFLPKKALEKVFRTAAYMSHSIWLGLAPYGDLSIRYDAGKDMQKPGLTDNSIIALTTAIGVFLLSLLSLAVYASFSRTWTYSLDAYALLRIGADLGKEALPFLLVDDANRIGELDDLPGWVGDVSEKDDTKVRQLGMGFTSHGARGITPLISNGKYLSYSKMPVLEWGAYDFLIQACNIVFGLCGLRKTKVGIKLFKFRQRYRRRRAERRARFQKRYAEWKWRSAWERFWNGEILTPVRHTPTYESLTRLEQRQMSKSAG